MKVEFYYSSQDQPSERFPVKVDSVLVKLKELERHHVPTEAIDVSKLDDVFRLYHKALVGPSSAKRAVFGMKGGLEADFGRTCPALYVYEDEADRYPHDAYPRTDTERGLIGVEQAVDELIAVESRLPAAAQHPPASGREREVH
jgi:hypothetical protein